VRDCFGAGDFKGVFAGVFAEDAALVLDEPEAGGLVAGVLDAGVLGVVGAPNFCTEAAVGVA